MIADIPMSMWRLLCNPVYVVTCLGACMELVIVSGFVVFLPKYLETQFSLGKSQASVFTGTSNRFIPNIINILDTNLILYVIFWCSQILKLFKTVCVFKTSKLFPCFQFLLQSKLNDNLHSRVIKTSR